MSSASPKLRRYVMTASIAAVTATGALYGAGLKTKQEFKEERKEVLQATPAERIEHLEAMKVRLVKQKMELQSKIDRLTAMSSDGQHESPEKSG